MKKLSVCLLVFLLTIAAYANAFNGSYYLTGKINGKYLIDMDIDIQGSSCTGTYQYHSQTSKLSVNGTVKHDGSVTLYEIAPNGSRTGVFKGQMRKIDGMMGITGTWSTPDGRTVYPFVVEEPGC